MNVVLSSTGSVDGSIARKQLIIMKKVTMTLVGCLLVCIAFASAQDDLDDLIKDVYQSSSVTPGYEVVTQKPMEDLGALDRCGEGALAGKKKCVPYYLCDGKTNTIIEVPNTDGAGIIDIRFGENQCDHPLDVCCKIPPGGEHSTGRPEPTPEPTASPKPPPIPKGCGIRNPNGIDFKITGATHGEAEYGEFPWMLEILKTNYKANTGETLAVCGGSLIAPNVVLTGAHCVYNNKTYEIKVRAGEWDTQTEKERLPYQERTVKEIIVHEQFNPRTLYNDVAVLVLTSAFDLDEHIGVVCLPEHNQKIDSEHCFASGWGKKNFGQHAERQVILKKIELPIVEHRKCEQALRTTRLGTAFKLHETFICAGGERGKDTCTGDGGGPLVCPDPYDSKRYVQAGIVAWGIGCGEENIPGVYGDVAKFRNWIEEKVKTFDVDFSEYSR